MDVYPAVSTQPQREVLAGRYELGEILGKGAHGVVYRGHDRETGSEVAVKVLRRDIGDDAHFAERLRREAGALRVMHGSSAVVMRDFGEDRWGAVFLVMEILEGETLDDHLFELEDFGDRLSAYRLLCILEPIARTLHLAHQNSIVHRDVKPGNIFLVDGPHDTVRLMDFGLAKIIGLADITRSGTVAGSPSYIAPELWRGEPVDHRIDIYSFAAVVYRALTAQPPFSGANMNELLTLVTTAPRPRVSALRPELGPSMDEWAYYALAAHAHQRYPDLATLWTELVHAIQRGENPAAYRAREHFGHQPW